MTQLPSQSTSQNSAGFEASSLPMSGDAIAATPAWQPDSDESVQWVQSDRMPTALPPQLLAPIRWWQGVSIRRKATALAIALGTVPLVGFGVLDYFRSSSTVVANASEAQEDLAIANANKVSRFMFERYGDIQALASLTIFTNPASREATSTREKEVQLKNFLEARGFYDSVALFDLNGNAIARAGGEIGRNEEGRYTNNIRDRDHFQAVLETGQISISQPSVSPTTNKVSIFFAAPVKDAVTGEMIAVVRTRLPVSYFNEFVQTAAETGSVGEDMQAEGAQSRAEFHLIDSSGKTFATTDPEEIGQDARVEVESFPDLQAAGVPTSAIAFDGVENFRQLVSYTPIDQVEGMPDLDWSLLLLEDTATAFAAQRTLVLALVLGLGLTAFIVSTFATYLADLATRPILFAAEAVERIGEGELETRLDFQGGDEVASLGKNINRMAASLQQSLDAQAFEAAQERLLTAAKGSGVVARADLQTILDQALEGARTLLKLDRIVVYRFNSETESGIVSESVQEGWVSALAQPVSDRCIPAELREAYRQGRVVATDNVATAELHPEHLQLLDRLHVQASLIVPILGGGQLFGLLIAHTCGATHQWQETEISFLKRLGGELGLSIYRVELLEQTTNLAEEQRQLKEDLQKRALELLQEVDPISRGDLTTRAKVTADEIGTIADSYNATVDNLRQIVLQVQHASNQVVNTTSSSEASVQSLSIEALRQAEEITTALELVQGMAEAVQMVALNAAQAELAVQQAAQTVEEGDAAMNRTVEGIQGIRATVADTAKKVKHLGESSQKISKVVELISAFAAQTNMLALNASIEASRAGEEGRGFAVVANEVRALARQSAEATEEIRGLIASIQAETNEVVTAMESGIEQVVTGTKLVDDTRQSLNKITTVSAQISELVEAIAQATLAQSQASDTVTQTMMDVAAIASKTSTEASQVSSSFEQLRKVAQTLQSGVGQFKV